MRQGSLLAAMGRRERVVFVAMMAAWVSGFVWFLVDETPTSTRVWHVAVTVQIVWCAYIVIRSWQLRHTMAEARESARRASQPRP